MLKTFAANGRVVKVKYVQMCLQRESRTCRPNWTGAIVSTRNINDVFCPYGTYSKRRRREPLVVANNRKPRDVTPVSGVTPIGSTYEIVAFLNS